MPCICDTPNRCRAMGTCRREQLRQAPHRLPEIQARIAQATGSNVIPFPARKPNAPTPPRKG